MFLVGDVVGIFAPPAGKRKYHLCVCCADVNGVEQFLYFNSKAGYEADYVIRDGQIDGLPTSKTGLTVISCSYLVRHSQQQLKTFRAQKIGVLSRAIAIDLAKFVTSTKALNRKQIALVVSELNAYGSLKT